MTERHNAEDGTEELHICNKCGENKPCIKQPGDEWRCNECIEDYEETEAWDEMLIQDAEEGGFI